ncbi:SDR family NAD(P)-dependent oxidoreductase [Methylobacterium isbiliense]|jgi:glucose 1-dehydrogenase|uniref:Oxidoreductase YohF n=1 Tax=Methylobacterium isbiliense TaxID=315478 RepID=A0ABQ4SMC0_9HYPH|nr:SDR family oxidoreductase [Methylobacterium isbiliense]MDN3626373.1 SDR family oxidoreductase [Methylobacterium isbiliense]GJE03038.1 putative oxidoreductase YohF [Methylobacterium isbiliense]
MKLDNQIALVTGGDSGIGQAIATLFAEAGADLCITYHTDADGAAETRRRIEAAGRQALVAPLDVRDAAAVDALFARVARELGVPDVLVNNAGKGMGAQVPVADLPDDQVAVILDTNLKGPLHCARAFVRQRRERGGGGRIVTISSVAQHLPTPHSAPYGMAKAGLGSLTRSLAIELAEQRINVNAIAPGLIATPMTQERLDDPGKRDASMKEIPWHRPGEPIEIARLALFLASEYGDYVTGQTWVMDGGLTMNWGGA